MKRNLSRLVRFLCLITTLGIFTIAQAQDTQTELDTVKFVIQPAMGVASTLIAKSEGLFEAQNIDLELVEMATALDSAALTALIQGEIDVLQVPLSPGIINSIAAGESLKAVAVGGYNDPDACSYWGFFVALGQGENFQGASLRGTHVSISNGVAQYYLHVFLQQYGLTSEDVIIENIPNESRGEALVNGAISLAWSTEPRLTRTIQEYGVEVVAESRELMPNAEFTVLWFGPSMLARGDELAVRFLTAYLQGAHLANEGATERNVEIMSEAIGFDEQTLMDTCWVTFRENGELNQEGAANYVSWLYDQELIDAVMPVDEFYDNSYLRQAVEIVAESSLEATPEAGS